MKKYAVDYSIKILTALYLLAALLLTFTVSDYYIFNRIGEFNALFVISQWVKKSGLLLLPLAVFYKKRSCADAAKYVLPVFILISCFTFGTFFDVTMMTASATPAKLLYASINEFMPKTANMALFFFANATELAVCILLFVRDGFKVSAKSVTYLPLAVIAVMPLNIFENFFDVNSIPSDSFLRFGNFTVWHLIAFLSLIGFTAGAYFFLKRQSYENKYLYLVALAIVLLVQYHSKNSMIMGDGYNVYHTVFACIPLFICNLGVYVASLSVILRKRVLYSVSFFVHAAGAVSVFFYFGKAEMSNYGIFCSYSLLYFCTVHCLLFALCVLPSTLGHYKFQIRDCVVPLVYYLIVIAVAAVTSGLVTSASMSFTYNGYTLSEDEWLYPNYAFTQVNPFPVDLFVIPLRIWKCDMNLLYLLILYLFYVGIFFAFNGAYYAFLAIRRKMLPRVPQTAGQAAVRYSPESEIAMTDAEDIDD